MGATMAKRRQKQALDARKNKKPQTASADKAQAENSIKSKKGK